MFWNFGKKKVNRERILALDLLRGAFLLEIIAFHIIWSPSLFIFITGGSRLPASAAEGFFTISGLLVGYLYGPKVLKETRKIFTKIWKRAALLYGLSVFFTIFYTAWAILEPESSKYATMWVGDPSEFFRKTFMLTYTFGWADFLSRYAVFMLFAPFAVWLIAKGKAWIVAAGSIAVWFFFRYTDIFLPYSAWQVVFMLGIILGYYLPHIESWFRNLPRTYRNSIAGIICSSALITYGASIISLVVIPIFHPDNQAVATFNNQLMSYFDKDHLDPARIAIGILWFAALYMTFRRYEKQISRYTLGILEVFGRQSLLVYCTHAFILFAIDIYFVPPVGHTKIANTIVTLGVMAIIYLIAYYRAHITEFGKKILSNRSTTQVP